MNNQKVLLSLLITYRQRKEHLETQLSWFSEQAKLGLLENIEILIVEGDRTSSQWIQTELKQPNFRYFHYPCEGIFPKTKALNLALKYAKGKLVTPFDVDLIPWENTLLRHLEMAELNPKLLLSGYRIMLDKKTIKPTNIATLVENAAIAPEDQTTALWKQLIHRERFGVLPFFQRDRLLEIGGWDENFLGWGGEDQDIIERYLADGRYFCRSPELIYLHLFHEKIEQWNETEIIAKNRQYYYQKRRILDILLNQQNENRDGT
ncbi:MULTISPECIES: galactosyltransferase-related protein [Spirulina sp. CCY15215]|uniref:galactosyltransferase-related protein n=1 Tax=Spirulina sp. CCY15215 TaxID=2767591 RepID=UPI0019512C17|nr:galactosyltransferase-related protein [Spirulina major]